MPTIKLNWLQPHEGSIVDFLFRARAFQHEGPVPPDDEGGMIGFVLSLRGAASNRQY